MAIHVKSFSIDGFRGISNLDVSGLNHINIIAGDNNSGKTSVLEALMIFDNPTSLATLFTVARLRESIAVTNTTNIYDSFINMFAKQQDEMRIDVDANYDKYYVRYEVSGAIKRIMIDPADMQRSTLIGNGAYIKNKTVAQLSDVAAFSGILTSEIHQVTKPDLRLSLKSIELTKETVEKELDDELKRSEQIELNEYSSATTLREKHSRLPRVRYLSPIAHITGESFDEIICNDSYKEICIKILQIFDEDIVDLLLLRSETTNSTIEYIKHSKYGNMPLNTYGDGIKKVLSLANAIAKANGGILLIDEVETAIHSKHYDNIFAFITKAAVQFDVQVFVTTHNLEAIDAFLKAQNYEDVTTDNISVVTLNKKEGKTYSRVLTGRQTYQNRESFDFEVRL